jgi:predicted site-specific integrase-resolvase
VSAPTLREVRAWPATCDPAQAALALGISRSTTYECLRRGDFPAQAIRVGGRWRVLTASLVSVLEGNANPVGQGGP